MNISPSSDARAVNKAHGCAHEFIPDGWVVTDSWLDMAPAIAIPQAWQTTHYRCKFCLMRTAVT